MLALAREGHERAFEALVHRYRKPLLAYSQRMLASTAKAEDAVQQALLQAWEALQRGAEVRDAQSWLYRIVHNAALRMRQAPGSGDAELSDSLVGADAPQAELERRISVRETLAGVAALPPLQRDALLRTAVDGHTHEQVGAMLGVSEGAVRGLVYRARANLRNAATALTPFPIVEWAAGRGGEALGVGAMVKGGATITAGVLVFGAAVAHQPSLGGSEHRDKRHDAGRLLSTAPRMPGHRARSAAGGGSSGASFVQSDAASDRGGTPSSTSAMILAASSGHSATGFSSYLVGASATRPGTSTSTASSRPAGGSGNGSTSPPGSGSADAGNGAPVKSPSSIPSNATTPSASLSDERSSGNPKTPSSTGTNATAPTTGDGNGDGSGKASPSTPSPSNGNGSDG